MNKQTKINPADLDFKTRKENLLGDRIESAECNGATFVRRSGSNIIYRRTSYSFDCTNCDSPATIQEKRVLIVRGPLFGPQGKIESATEEIPYCPSCEQEPPAYNIITIFDRVSN